MTFKAPDPDSIDTASSAIIGTNFYFNSIIKIIIVIATETSESQIFYLPDWSQKTIELDAIIIKYFPDINSNIGP